MKKYLIRLDDASDYMDIKKWDHMKNLLDQYGIKPIFGIIPDNKDESLTGLYEKNPKFWEKMQQWVQEGWTPALHGYEHRYVTEDGGINPVNARSEFAGLCYEEQAEKIEKGYEILKNHDIIPEIFFAPSHTFDDNTLKSIKEKTPIRVISDTVANDIYKKGNFWFIPQQSGVVRKLPFSLVTFCYHPNTMEEKDFEILEIFLKTYKEFFVSYDRTMLVNRRISLYDRILKWLYFARRR